MKVIKSYSFGKNLGYIYALNFILIIILLVFFNQLDNILYIPFKTPEMWCEGQPCIEIDFLSFKILLVQPTSTLFVYLLGFITLLLGVYVLRISKGNKFVFWWGIALLLWGIGAIFAGTSY